MKLSLDDYHNPTFDPWNTKFDPIAGVGDEFLENAIIDPALFAAKTGLDRDAMAEELTRMALVDTLRQQQFIVFNVGKRVGITGPFLNATRQALGYLDFDLPAMRVNRIEGTLLETGIGIAAAALSAIPNIYTQIVAAALNLGVGLAHWAIDLFGGDATIARLVTPLLPVQEYSDETDEQVFNGTVLPQMRAQADWTSFFMPRYQGQLSGVARRNRAGQMAIGWALGNGSIPRAIYDGGGKYQQPGRWHIAQDQQPFLGSGGLGFMPGGQRIYAVTQTTAVMDQIGPWKSHKQVFNKNCAGIEQVERIDTGTFFPTTTQGIVSLWDFILQRGPALYTIDPVGLYDGRASTGTLGWRPYLNAIWEGVVELWRNSYYEGGEGGWGCSFWKAALMALVQNYTVADPELGIGVLSWTPTTNTKLTLEEQDDWERYNVFDKIIKPALDKVLLAQAYYLGNTTLAAYLPIYGGVDANPLNQDKVMGAMHEYYIRDIFVKARRRILDGPMKYDVRLNDVLDKTYRKQIKDRGGGTTGPGMPQFTALPPVPDLPVPTGGNGLPGLTLPPRQPAPPGRRASPYLIGGGVALAGTAAGFYFWDDIARLLSAVRTRLPGPIRRRLP